MSPEVKHIYTFILRKDVGSNNKLIINQNSWSVDMHWKNILENKYIRHGYMEFILTNKIIGSIN